ncbi:Bifunctional riboflavin biosynthesis protein RIBA 1, chloroplastic [Cucurbita argyrosperma subsp. argyrosperma]|nr:Bifunctional riboflavin biosynthesis protein RIBA 1, chloroplastic [Cucurbita argyrosperma subsp. argyrosperma]
MAFRTVSFQSTPPISHLQRFKDLQSFGGINHVKPYVATSLVSELTSSCKASKLFLGTRGSVQPRATLISGEGGVLSSSNGNAVVSNDIVLGNQLDSASTRNSFPVGEDEYDFDRPTAGFAAVADAVEDIRQGKMVLVVDDEDRENEGDLIMAAQAATPEAMAFIVKHGTGIVCVAMKGEDLERLQIPLMVNEKENEEKLCTAFTVTVQTRFKNLEGKSERKSSKRTIFVSGGLELLQMVSDLDTGRCTSEDAGPPRGWIDAREGTTTGVSASDRATTVLKLASRDSKPYDFKRPGHIFPLKYREGGVLKRAGHTEASVDLAMLAGLDPVGILCEVVDDDGSMARLPKLREFAKRENLKIISIADLVRYRRKRDRLVECAGAAARMPTTWGPFQAYCYRSILDGIEHIAMVKRCNEIKACIVQGDIGDGQDILVRVHSECLTGDIFGSARCDCGNQLALAMQLIEAAGRGVLVYLRGHEGRGIGLGHKLRAYNLQDAGRDTVEANEELGLPVDSREYGIGAQILRDLGVRTMKLMTNNPTKYKGLKGYGLEVSGRVPLITPITKDNKRYLETKRAKMGHIYNLDFGSRFRNLIDDHQTSNSSAESSDASQTLSVVPVRMLSSETEGGHQDTRLRREVDTRRRARGCWTLKGVECEIPHQLGSRTKHMSLRFIRPSKSSPSPSFFFFFLTMAARPSAVLSFVLAVLLLVYVANGHEGHVHPPSSEPTASPPPGVNAAIMNSFSYSWSMVMAMVATSWMLF